MHLAINGVPSPLEIFIYAWLATPLLVACYLSRTGHYERAQIMSSLALAVLITMIGAMTGGISSFAAVWLVVVPIEAALAASRRVVVVACDLALAAAALLYAGEMAPILPAGRAVPHAGAAWRSARPRSMRRASRSAALRLRAQARGFSSWRRTAIGCSRATSTT